MKKLSLLFSLCTSLVLFAQEDFNVSIQSNMIKPIPYAKVFFEGKDYYKNTDKKGRLKLKKDEKISKISATGFEDFFTSENQKEYVLKSKEINIQIVAIPKNKQQITIGKTDKKSTRYVYTSSKYLRWAEYIPYEKSYPEVAFIKSVKFLTSSTRGKNKPIILKFYRNDNGKPGELYGSMEYIVECKPGNRIYEVDITDGRLILPKEGLYIGFDWVNIPSNIRRVDFTKYANGNKIDEKLKTINEIVEPAILYETTDSEINYYHLTSKGWIRPNAIGKPNKISFEIILTD
jgi:hypothetical protein